MGAPFEGDMGVKDLLSEMPDWVKKQVDFDDYVNYLKPPVGTWAGRIHRVTIDSDCHTNEHPHRRIFRSRPREGVEGWGRRGRMGPAEDLAAGSSRTKFLKGKKFKGKEVYGFLDQPKPWGGFGFYFLCSRAHWPTPSIPARRTVVRRGT